MSELFAEYDRGECVDKYLEVESPGAVAEIVEVVFEAPEHLLHRVGVAVVERGVGCRAGSYLVEVGVTVVVFKYLVDIEFALGTRSDERHVALEDVVELRYLIEMVGAQEAADSGEARVIVAAAVAQLRPHLLGVEAHGAELVDVERAPETSDTFLTENGRAAVLALDGYGAECADGSENQQREPGKSHVDNALCIAGEGRHAVGDEMILVDKLTDVCLDYYVVIVGLGTAQFFGPLGVSFHQEAVVHLKCDRHLTLLRHGTCLLHQRCERFLLGDGAWHLQFL